MMKLKIKHDGMPVLVLGEKLRIEYIIQNLISIGIQRSAQAGIMHKNLTVSFKILN
jgi:hypothetical protein